MSLTKETPEGQLPVHHRSMQETDSNFIYNSWLKSFRNGTMTKNVPNAIYFTNHHKIIDKLLRTAKTIVCCNTEDPSIIYGFINYEIVDDQFVLHYVYVKHTYRKLGIAKNLLAQTGHSFEKLGCYTHQTQFMIAQEESLKLVYHPYLLITGV
jgi:hypothetical protein